MTRVKGPKNGVIVTANFVGVGKSKKNFSNAKHTKGLVLLSIAGNKYCTDEYLGAMVMHATENYQSTTFLIADEVYWHNLKKADNLSEAEENNLSKKLKNEAEQFGADYIERNLKHFLAPFHMTPEDFNEKHPHATTDEKISLINEMAQTEFKKFEIIRWKTWTHNSVFYNNRAAIMSLYETEESLKEGIETTATNFANHHQKEGGFELWHQRSKGYLTEESPAVMWLGALLGYNFVIYPGEMIPAFVKTKAFFIVSKDSETTNPFAIPTENPNLLVNWLDVDFRRSHPKDLSILPGNGNNFSSFFSPSLRLIQTAKSTGGNSEEDINKIIEDFERTFLSLSHMNRLKVVNHMATLIEHMKHELEEHMKHELEEHNSGNKMTNLH